jgi:two-component system, cell cycle response regulator DivK
MANEAILVVDDNLNYLHLARVLLQREEYQVATATNAEEALEVLKTFNPQLILMDIQLPGMNGLDLTRRLKANRRTRGIVVIAFTGDTGAEQHALRAGCDGFIAKPIDTRSLTRVLREHLRREIITAQPS